MSIDAIVWVGLGSIIINLLILTLSIKLYTEYFKDVSSRNRKHD